MKREIEFDLKAQCRDILNYDNLKYPRSVQKMALHNTLKRKKQAYQWMFKMGRGYILKRGKDRGGKKM